MRERLSPQREAEIRERVEAATPGHWGSHRNLSGEYTVEARPRTTRYGMENDGNVAAISACRSDSDAYVNARFIAHAREDVPALLAELSAVRAERDEARVRVWVLESPAIETRRAEIRSSYAELIAQAEQDRDHEGAAVVRQQLAEREAVWARDGELAKEFATDPLALRPYGTGATS